MNNIQQMAAILQGFGRGGDTMLAHINPKEAMLLNEVTDGGTINPVTGMPEFFIEGEIGGYDNPDFGSDFSDMSFGSGMDDVDMGMGVIPTWMDFPHTVNIYDATKNPYTSFDGPLGQNYTYKAGDVGASMSVDNIPNVNQPSLLGAILSAPFETLGNVFGVDAEFTGRDVFGPDFSRAMAGVENTTQPIGFEVNPLGIVGTVAGGPMGGLLSSVVSPTYEYELGSGEFSKHGGLGEINFPEMSFPEMSFPNFLSNKNKEISIKKDDELDPEGSSEEIKKISQRSFLGSPVVTPEQVAEVKINQLANALARPGYTRPEGIVYI
tara:strand:+ start:2067 stop:3035 length:969 start_codon:yes stop_codon:yes gene_type:complete